jgi:Ala-tRNA(Pro) deacylase
MPMRPLLEFLNRHQVKYVTVSHSPAHTAQEIAASAHVPGQELAQTVMVKLAGTLAMAVLPASDHSDFQRLTHARLPTSTAIFEGEPSGV